MVHEFGESEKVRRIYRTVDLLRQREMEMVEQNDDLIGWTSNEFRELLTDGHYGGTTLAQRTVTWLKPWWTELGLPVAGDTGFPIISTDLLIHAGAVTAVAMWERQGFDKMVMPHIHTSDFALQRFVQRVLSGDANQYMGDEGKQLFAAVSAFERDLSVPMSLDSVDAGSSMVMVGTPESEGLDMLAELLLEFSGLSGTEINEQEKDAN